MNIPTAYFTILITTEISGCVISRDLRDLTTGMRTVRCEEREDTRVARRYMIQTKS